MAPGKGTRILASALAGAGLQLQASWMNTGILRPREPLLQVTEQILRQVRTLSSLHEALVLGDPLNPWWP